MKRNTPGRRKSLSPTAWEYVKALRKRTTDAESELCGWLDYYGINYVFQQPVGSGLKFFIVDFLIECRSGILCVEVDGGYHNIPRQIVKDRKRNRLIRKMGYSIVRFSNDSVFNTPDEVIGCIMSYNPKRTKNCEHEVI